MHMYKASSSSRLGSPDRTTRGTRYFITVLDRVHAAVSNSNFVARRSTVLGGQNTWHGKDTSILRPCFCHRKLESGAETPRRLR